MVGSQFLYLHTCTPAPILIFIHIHLASRRSSCSMMMFSRLLFSRAIALCSLSCFFSPDQHRLALSLPVVRQLSEPCQPLCSEPSGAYASSLCGGTPLQAFELCWWNCCVTRRTQFFAARHPNPQSLGISWWQFFHSCSCAQKTTISFTLNPSCIMCMHAMYMYR